MSSILKKYIGGGRSHPLLFLTCLTKHIS